MTPDFLKALQGEGYVIEAVAEDACIVRCPSLGCGVRFKVSKSGVVPRRDPNTDRPSDRVIGGFEDLRQVLLARREELLLTIPEVEATSGVATSQIAKCERENVTRPLGVDGAVNWAGALGYELVLRPVPLPRITLSVLADTRRKVRVREQTVARRRSGYGGE